MVQVVKILTYDRHGLGDDIRALTNIHLHKVVPISQTIFSDAFSWMKSFVSWLKCHWSLFLRVQFIISSFGLDDAYIRH